MGGNLLQVVNLLPISNTIINLFTRSLMETTRNYKWYTRMFSWFDEKILIQKKRPPIKKLLVVVFMGKKIINSFIKPRQKDWKLISLGELGPRFSEKHPKAIFTSRALSSMTIKSIKSSSTSSSLTILSNTSQGIFKLLTNISLSKLT